MYPSHMEVPPKGSLSKGSPKRRPMLQPSMSTGSSDFSCRNSQAEMEDDTPVTILITYNVYLPIILTKALSLNSPRPDPFGFATENRRFPPPWLEKLLCHLPAHHKTRQSSDMKQLGSS